MVEAVWEWLKFKLVELDISLNTDTDEDLLSLNFQKGLRENAVLWMIGIYVDMVEKEVVQRGNKLGISMATGIFKQKKLMSRNQALPELGIVPGLETDSMGIG